MSSDARVAVNDSVNEDTTNLDEPTSSKFQDRRQHMSDQTIRRIDDMTQHIDDLGKNITDLTTQNQLDQPQMPFIKEPNRGKHDEIELLILRMDRLCDDDINRVAMKLERRRRVELMLSRTRFGSIGKSLNWLSFECDILSIKPEFYELRLADSFITRLDRSLELSEVLKRTTSIDTLEVDNGEDGEMFIISEDFVREVMKRERLIREFHVQRCRVTASLDNLLKLFRRVKHVVLFELESVELISNNFLCQISNTTEMSVVISRDVRLRLQHIDDRYLYHVAGKKIPHYLDFKKCSMKFSIYGISHLFKAARLTSFDYYMGVLDFSNYENAAFWVTHFREDTYEMKEYDDDQERRFKVIGGRNDNGGKNHLEFFISKTTRLLAPKLNLAFTTGSAVSEIEQPDEMEIKSNRASSALGTVPPSPAAGPSPQLSQQQGTPASQSAPTPIPVQPGPPPGSIGPEMQQVMMPHGAPGMPSMPPEGAPSMPNRQPGQAVNNNSPLLAGLLSNQQPPQGMQPNPGQQPMNPAQRLFSPYQYPPQPGMMPHPQGQPMDPQQMAAMQERQRIMMNQQAMQQQQMANQVGGQQGGPPGPPRVPMNCPPCSIPPGAMPGQPLYHGQPQRMPMPPGYPGGPQVPPQEAMPPHRRPQEEAPPPKKKRKSTKKQQQKEAELAASAAAQSAQQQQYQMMVAHPHHMGPGGMMGYPPAGHGGYPQEETQNEDDIFDGRPRSAMSAATANFNQQIAIARQQAMIQQQHIKPKQPKQKQPKQTLTNR